MAAPSSEPSAVGLTLYYDEKTPRCNWYVKQLYKQSLNKTNHSMYTIFTCLFFHTNSSHLGMSQPATPHISIYGQ